ncbi:peroxiredoxin [Acidiphilium iwatense]|uniref:Alkyl hydroperoxide reductase C n=1 Tax=Acidiphilium iwatense TaxID=768198 RepID=A0ABS9E1V1_9PROT|nr:peroxiredoxin [Acidiphilium iwatense]MCF3948380.1 peroxiredoxin [Acidiphilium iwatense]
MALRIGDTAPDFEQLSTHGLLRFHAWKGSSWTVLFSHPHDFTPVCTTELGEAARLTPNFAARGAKLLALSVDTPERHAAWAEDIAAVSGHRPSFPIIADHDREVAHLYDMIHPNAATTQTVRATFIIDPRNVVRLIQSYPNAIGRNFAEILRALDALRLTDAEPVVTPVNWRNGEPVIAAPHLADAELLRRFGAPLATDLPYLRRVAQPALA